MFKTLPTDPFLGVLPPALHWRIVRRMEHKPWNEWTDAELVTEVATSGRAPGGAVEMMRRLKDSNSFLAYVNIGLTMAALIFSAVQIVR